MATDNKYEYVGDGRPDGVILGQTATDKVGFYGATPVVQQEIAVAATSQGASYDQTKAESIVTLVNNLRTELIELGLLVAA